MKKGERALLIFGILETLLSLCALTFYIIFSVDAINKLLLNTGELGDGISIAFLLVFMVIFGAAVLALAVIDTLIFFFGLRCENKRVKIFLKLTFIYNMVAAVATAVLFAVTMIINNGN